MPRKKQTKRFDKVAAVKAAARAAVGAPPATRKQDHEREKQPRHKPTLRKLLSDPDA